MGLAGVLRTDEWVGFDVRAKLKTQPDWCPVRMPRHACSSLWEILGADPLLVLAGTWVCSACKLQAGAAAMNYTVNMHLDQAPSYDCVDSCGGGS
jgi:hypothetical protein